MVRVTAGMRICAAVTVPLTLDLPVHEDDRLVEVDIGAPQAQRFILPQVGAIPDGFRARPSRAETSETALMRLPAGVGG